MKLKSILFNLIGNSIKYTQKGKIDVEIWDEDWSLGYRKISMKITDTGLGIKKEDIPKLFKLFGKLKQNNGINESGVGLGLTIVKNFIE